MADYTFHSLIEPLKDNNTIQTILDVDALAAPAKAALIGYVASLGLLATETQHLLWENVGVAVLIESLAITYYLPSLGIQTPAPALKRTSTLQDKVIEMQALESKFPKCQMLIFARTSSATDWIWLNTEVLQNSGNRVNTIKLIPYLNQANAFIPGRATQIGIQFIADPVSTATLPQAGDRLTVQGSIGLDINPMGGSKKNDEVEGSFEDRLASLESSFRLFGPATATAAGTTGLVEGAGVGQAEFLLRGDRTWQNPVAFVRAVGEQLIAGLKTFSEVLTGNKFVRSIGVGDLGELSNQSQAAIWSSGSGGYLSLVSAAAPTNLKIIDFELNSEGSFNLRRTNDAYNTVISNLLQFDASHNLKLFNFTNFGGNVAIKILLMNGVTSSSQGSVTLIPLSIDATKILGLFPAIQYKSSGSKIAPEYTRYGGLEYSSYVDNGHLVFWLSDTNSFYLLNKPYSCLIFYTN